MPTITNQGVLKALVTAFILNNRDEGAAMRKIGYSEGYSTNGHCAKLFARGDVRAEIRRQEMELLRKTGLTKEHFAYDLEEAKRLSMIIKQPSAAVSAINTNMRLHGMDQIAGDRESAPPVFSPEEVEELQAMAKRATLAIKNTVKRA